MNVYCFVLPCKRTINVRLHIFNGEHASERVINISKFRRVKQHNYSKMHFESLPPIDLSVNEFFCEALYNNYNAMYTTFKKNMF